MVGVDILLRSYVHFDNSDVHVVVGFRFKFAAATRVPHVFVPPEA